MRPVLVGAALLVSIVYAQLSTFCPSGDICYGVNIPASGATSDMFFQISAPTTMQWIGLGQGSQMSGSNIFVIYANADGSNVTLSPRLGTGHTEPDSDTAAKVTLLDGSGIKDGKMVANVKCTSCQSWSGGTMDFDSQNSDWIYAYKSGDPLNTNSLDATITQHDQFDSFTLNLAAAQGGDGSVNPFTNSVTDKSGNSTVSTPSNSTSSTSSSSGENSSPGRTTDQKVISNGSLAHGIMGVVAFVLLFPFGSISIRVFNFPGIFWVHISLQIGGYLVALALMETGVWIAVTNKQLTLTHPLIGLVVVCGLFFQPFLGLGHHLLFKRRVKSGLKGGPNALTYPHIWWGRALITLGMVNGGLGLVLTGRTSTIEIIYIAIAGTVWAIWMGLAAWTYVKGRRGSGFRGEKNRPVIRRISEESEEMRNFSQLGAGKGLETRDY